MATNVDIDGFNLYYGAVNGTPNKWLDLEALCHRLLPKDDIKRIRYFTATVSARPGDPQQPQRQQTYLRALTTLPPVSIHYGHFLTHSVRMPLVNPPTAGAKDRRGAEDRGEGLRCESGFSSLAGRVSERLRGRRRDLQRFRPPGTDTNR